ncbi:actin cytoskeleton-regulatory complex protein pan1-like [Alosa sapidissima]|uniref:actin cytoskeleton-regulatory complex protein pan1-like n=1 Tax=Alosa sapidissima TaxID=34773 RepID=UPI001C09BFA2|nr:actin cytoskeleton-regulatory complex protein pan1-like [Alosa sapidissima]
MGTSEDEGMTTKKDNESQNNERKKAVGQTKWAVRCFQNWCFEHLGHVIDFNAVSKTELNEILCKFYITVRNGRGESYGFSGFMGLRAGLNRHLSEPPQCWCLAKDREFMSSNGVFMGLAKKLRSETDLSVHQKTDGDFIEVKRWKVLDPSTPEGSTIIIKQDLDGSPTPCLASLKVDGSPTPCLAGFQVDLSDSDSSGGNYLVAQVGLEHVTESWGTPDTPAPFKTEDDEGGSDAPPEESISPVVSGWPSIDEYGPYLTDSQIMGRVRQERFTQEELGILVREVHARYHIIYGRGVSPAETRRAWEEVTLAVNSTGLGHTRTAAGCHKRFNDLKRRSKMKQANGVGSKASQRPESGPAGEDAQSASVTATPVISSFEGRGAGPGGEEGDHGKGAVEAPSWSQESLNVWARSLDTHQQGEIVHRSRFTKEQTAVLLCEINARRHQIFGDGQHASRSSARRQAWEEVTATVNGARCGPTKTAAACIKRFNDFRRRHKNNNATGKHIISVLQGGTGMAAAFPHTRPTHAEFLPSVKTEPQEGPENTLTAAATTETGTAPSLATMPALAPLTTAQAPMFTPTPPPEPDPHPTVKPEPTPTPEPEPIPTPEPTPTAEPIPTPPPEPDPHPTVKPEPIPTPEPEPEPIPTPEPTPTAEPIPTPTPEPDPDPTATPMAAPTEPSPTRVSAPTVTATPSPAPPPSLNPRAAAAPSTPTLTPSPPPTPAPPTPTPPPNERPAPPTPTLTPAPPPTPAPPTPTPPPNERPAAGAEDGPSGADGASVGPPEGGSTGGECVCAGRRRWESELLEVQRGGLAVLQGELGALRRGLDTRLRRMESRTHPLLLSVSRSLERIASAMERNAHATVPPDTHTPPRTPRGRAVVERPAASQSRGSYQLQGRKRKRGRRT